MPAAVSRHGSPACCAVTTFPSLILTQCTDARVVSATTEATATRRRRPLVGDPRPGSGRAPAHPGRCPPVAPAVCRQRLRLGARGRLPPTHPLRVCGLLSVSSLLHEAVCRALQLLQNICCHVLRCSFTSCSLSHSHCPLIACWMCCKLLDDLPECCSIILRPPLSAL